MITTRTRNTQLAAPHCHCMGGPFVTTRGLVLSEQRHLLNVQTSYDYRFQYSISVSRHAFSAMKVDIIL